MFTLKSPRTVILLLTFTESQKNESLIGETTLLIY